jgi:hypothetical protein
MSTAIARKRGVSVSMPAALNAVANAVSEFPAIGIPVVKVAGRLDFFWAWWLGINRAFPPPILLPLRDALRYTPGSDELSRA